MSEKCFQRVGYIFWEQGIFDNCFFEQIRVVCRTGNSYIDWNDGYLLIDILGFSHQLLTTYWLEVTHQGWGIAFFVVVIFWGYIWLTCLERLGQVSLERVIYHGQVVHSWQGFDVCQPVVLAFGKGWEFWWDGGLVDWLKFGHHHFGHLFRMRIWHVAFGRG